jgi:hypothetical protein
LAAGIKPEVAMCSRNSARVNISSPGHDSAEVAIGSETT